MDLDSLRKRLDALDEQIITLLSERARVVERVAHFKKQRDIPVHIPERELALMERLRGRNPGPLTGDALDHIYRTILEEMRGLENERLTHERPSIL